MKKQKITPLEKKLVRRYLLWCYKTTREDLERIDRKFTQLIVDYFVLGELTKLEKKNRALIGAQIDGFKDYINKKEESAYQERFSDVGKRVPKPEYFYLRSRLAAVEKAIQCFLGQKDLLEISRMYEAEMTKRILEAREHR